MIISPPTSHDWFSDSHNALSNDLALFAIAEAEMRMWCESLGGVPTDAAHLLKMRCAFEPSARRHLTAIMLLPDDLRRALAHKIWPANRRLPMEAK